MIRSFFLLTFILLSASTLSAQKNAPAEKPMLSTTLTPQLLMKTKPVKTAAMPVAFSYKDLGFFCKMEYKIEKKVPLMIRLGEVKSTEKMEGKRNVLVPKR